MDIHIDFSKFVYIVYFVRAYFWYLIIGLTIFKRFVGIACGFRFKRYNKTILTAYALEQAKGEMINSYPLAYATELAGYSPYNSNLSIGGDKALSDGYDFKHDVIYLSIPTWFGNGVASLAVACHEAGHRKLFLKKSFWSLLYKNTSYTVYYAMAYLAPAVFFLVIAPTSIFGQLGILAVLNILVHFLASTISEAQASIMAYKFIKAKETLLKNELSRVRKMLTIAFTTYVLELMVKYARLLVVVAYVFSYMLILIKDWAIFH